MRSHACRDFLLLVVSTGAFAFFSTTAQSQELVPRAYWPAPRGTNLLVLGYQYSTGDVVTDPALPIEGADSTVNYAQVSYQRTVDLFGRTANLQFNLPYARGTAEGLVEGEFQRRDVSAFADARFLLSINLLGAPSMDGAEFRQLLANPRPIVGASILVQPPTGDYDKDRVINAGTNRWSTKVAVGAIWPTAYRWLLDAQIGAWFFGDNDDFVGTTRKQEPIVSAELHLIRDFDLGIWAALDLNYYIGGETTVGDEVRSDEQRNSRIGVTLFYPFKRRHALRVTYSTGIITHAGGDYDTATANYAYAW
jgi:hypothetical protein